MRLRIRAMGGHGHATHSDSSPPDVAFAERRPSDACAGGRCGLHAPERRWKRCTNVTSAWIAGSSPAMTKKGRGKHQRKRFGGETPTDAIRILPGLTGPAAPWIAKAHIYRRSTAVLVPRSLSSARDSAPGQASCDVAGTRFAHPFERALPAPACPSPAIAPRAPVVVPER